jgi:hypothetical protein
MSNLDLFSKTQNLRIFNAQYKYLFNFKDKFATVLVMNSKIPRFWKLI